MGKSQRDKGKRGERELAALFREYGFDARRTSQYCGQGGAADVTGLPGFHVECKRCERLCLPEWIKQAERDSQGQPIVVCHRRNGEEWFATLPLRELLGLVRRAEDDTP